MAKPEEMTADVKSTMLSIDEEKLSSTLPAEMNPDFLVIRIVARIVLSVLRKFWALSSALFITIFILYWQFGGLVALILLCISSAGIVYHAGDKLLYYPDTPPDSRIYVPAPNVIGLPFENIHFKSEDSTKLHAFFMLQPQPSNCPTVLFLHGNAGNIGHRLTNAKGLYKELSANIFLLEYRGYGLSDGNPSESGLYHDAQAALLYLLNRKDIDTNQIIVFGRSLGGAVAIDLASKQCNVGKINCLLIENSFTSIPDMAKQIIPWKGLKHLPIWFYKNKFQSKCKVAALHCPVVFISGLSDQLVPPSMMLDLYTKCSSERKLLLQISNGDHNGTWTKPQYYAQLARAIHDVCSNQTLTNHAHTTVHTI